MFSEEDRFFMLHLVRELAAALRTQAKQLESLKRGVRLAIAPRLPVVHGDRELLFGLLHHLIENAIKHMGGQPEPRIDVATRRDADADVVFVRDNGAGIDPRYHDQVFRLFERLDTRFEGTGIGLALVRRIVELHDGRVWVESEGAGLGSTFCFTLAPGPSVDESSAPRA